MPAHTSERSYAGKTAAIIAGGMIGELSEIRDEKDGAVINGLVQLQNAR